MSFYIGIAKLHADIPHETLTFLEDSKNALSPRMFNIFLCFSVFHIHTELISSQYMPGGRISQSQEKGLRPRRKQHVPQLFPPRRPSVPVNTEVHGHREKPPSTSVFTGAVRFKGKLFPAMILPYGSTHARPISRKGPGKFYERPSAFHLPSGLFPSRTPAHVFFPAFHGFSGNRGNKKPGFPMESRA